MPSARNMIGTVATRLLAITIGVYRMSVSQAEEPKISEFDGIDQAADGGSFLLSKIACERRLLVFG